MSEPEQTFGQEATEAAAGNFPIYRDAPPEDVLTPSDAAEAIAEPRPEEKPTIVRDYIKRREDGVPVTVDRDSDGNPLYAAEDPHGYVTAEEAARDLAATRQAEADALKQAENFEAQKLLLAWAATTGAAPAHTARAATADARSNAPAARHRNFRTRCRNREPGWFGKPADG